VTLVLMTLATGGGYADSDDPTPVNTGPEFGKASPVGLLVVALLIVGTVLLIRSMNRHLKKLPGTFDPEHPEPDQAADEGTIEIPGDPNGADPADPARPRPHEPG